ncbi:MAG TPA: hypothetical protein VMI56_22995 [Reyranella sp.]|nr:hypothetical protein [Reyranella sp.]
MKRLLLLATVAALGFGLAGCEVGYTEHTAYVPDDYGYVHGHTYYSQGDYYRHYNGIDG